MTKRRADLGGTKALLIEGGGLRSGFSAGVAAELARAGARFDDVIAVS